MCSLNSIGQTLTQQVKGKIINQQTGSPLEGVTIVLINSNPLKGTTTNEKGDFILKRIPVGRASFKFSLIGYEDYFAPEISISSAKQVVLNIKLIEALGQLDEIVIVTPKNNIKPNNKLAVVSARSFDVDETKRFPSSINDPGRMALSFAGVTTTDDATNEIIVRGNPSNQLLWRIEGMEVPTPSHFVGSGNRPGAVSLLNNNLLGKSDFFTGAFPAEYGNALSGVFDINLRRGNSDVSEYALQVGTLGADIAAEGPFSKNYKGSYLVNYRYSTLKLLNKVIEVSKGGAPKYQDVAVKLYFPLSDRSYISVWGIAGLSEDDKKKEIVSNGKYEEDEFFKSGTYMTGLTYSHSFKNNSKLNIRSSVSGTYSDVQYKLMDITSKELTEKRDEVYNNALRFNADYTKKINRKTTVKMGNTLSFLHYNIDDLRAVNNDKEETEEVENAYISQIYVQAKHRFTNNLSGNLGIHSTYFSLNKDFLVEPRLGVEWRAAPKHTFSLGVGMHSRILPVKQYFTHIANKQPNKNLESTSAIHYVLGYDWRIIKNGHFKVELYYQDLNNIAITKDPLITSSSMNGRVLNNLLTSDGIGKNYGVELTFEKFFSNNYYYLLTTSLYDSKYKAANKRWYNSTYNYKYSASFVGGKEFNLSTSRNTILGVNLKSLFSGGRRSTPRKVNTQGSIVLEESKRNTIQLKDYLRLDLGLYARINRPKVTHTISLDIQNLLNRVNLEDEFINPVNGLKNIDTQLGLIPGINYKIEF